MQQKHKIHLALPRHEAIRDATEKALHAASNLGLGNYELTGEIDGADVIVTDSATVAAKLAQLPKSVRYLQLIDCGPGPTQVSAEYVTFANASSILVEAAANWALEQWHEISGHSNPTNQQRRRHRRLRVPRIRTWQTLTETRRPSLGQRHPNAQTAIVPASRRTTLIARHAPLNKRRRVHRHPSRTNIESAPNPPRTQTPNHQRRSHQPLRPPSRRQIRHPNPQLHQRPTNRLPRNVLRPRRRLSNSERPELLTRYILDNLGKYALGHQPRCIIEPVTHSTSRRPSLLVLQNAPPPNTRLKSRQANQGAIPINTNGTAGTPRPWWMTFSKSRP